MDNRLLASTDYVENKTVVSYDKEEQASDKTYGFLIALSASNTDSEKHRLLENCEGKDIPGEYKSMSDNARIPSEEETQFGGPLETTNESSPTRKSSKSPIKRSPKSPRHSTNEAKEAGPMKPNKKGLHLQLNVQAATRHTQKNFHNHHHINTPVLTPGSRGTPKPMNVAVFLKEGEGRPLVLERGKITTAGEIKQMMLETLSIPRTMSHMFAIWFISPHLELQLKDHHIPFLLRKQWADMLEEFSLCKDEDDRLKDEPVLVFQRNSFLSTSEEEKVTDKAVIERLFEEAKHNILKARYPVPVPDAEILGGMLARIKLGPYIEDKHKPGFFRKSLSDYLPYYAIGSNKLIQYIRQNGSEHRLLQQYQRATNKCNDVLTCQIKFLSYCRSLPFYGCAFFKGAAIQEGLELKPWKSCERSVMVGINRQGITLFNSNKDEVLIHLPYDDLSWECIRDEEDCDDIFCIEYDTANNDGDIVPEQVQIISKQSCMMDAMVTSCTNFMNIMNIPKTPTSADYKKILDISYSTIPKKHNFSLTRPFKTK